MGSAPARAGEHAIAWPALPTCGGAALQTDPPGVLLPEADPQEAWPLAVASAAAEPSLPGSEVPTLTREIQIHLPPVAETWDQVAERLHAVSHERWSRGASAEGGPWLFVALSGTAGLVASFALAIGVVQTRAAR